ncbi:MAG TPA: SDR family NAD(P)-dependent oxidoreductase [Candidatus Ruania gallistercoris]|uniref:SDR family NAD(P)-dependent oxidoreductase n=1 Tax=Candidatus Ruania gallistercoris TaxID=2838746 RepID=A0A9D2J532_9MICO|nr:SDR family NAD(P)-dependent oxidoreductase [Candidatus Ruania gallistercoris]
MQITPSTVALISGGASGLGEATARRMIAAGGAVVLLDLPSSPGAALAAELGERARFAPADVRDEDQVRSAVEMARDLGELRAVVSCAGVATPGRILGKKGLLPLDDYRQVVEINLVGTFNLLRLAAEAMAGNEPIDGGADRGVAILTASVAAFEGQVGQAAYASSKGGVASLVLTAARDLAQHGIRVAGIAPGIFETPMMAGLGEEVRSGLEALVPHPHRLGRPEEYAALAEHIMTNSYLNGEVIRLDGALRMPPR